MHATPPPKRTQTNGGLQSVQELRGMHGRQAHRLTIRKYLGIFPDGMQKEFIGVHSDSMVAVACLQSLSVSLHNDTLGHLVQVFHSLCVRLSTHILPRHIPSVENVLVDRLSRRKWASFGQAAQTWSQDMCRQHSEFLHNLGNL
jgi:hypothetical protein